MKVLVGIGVLLLASAAIYVWIRHRSRVTDSKVLINEPIDGPKTDDAWRDLKFRVAKVSRNGNDNRLLLTQQVGGKPLSLIVDVPADLIPGLKPNFDVVEG